MREKRIALFDLEGPISIIDFAAELGRMISKRSNLDLKDFNMGEFFTMISDYDNYLIDSPGIKKELNIPDYQPGDTLRLMAPLYVAAFSDNDLITLAESNLGLLPGCKKLMQTIRKDWDIYVISTSYNQFAYNVTENLGIHKDHVYCTKFKIDNLKRGSKEVKEIYWDLDRRIHSLDNNIWKKIGNEWKFIKMKKRLSEYLKKYLTKYYEKHLSLQKI